MKYPKAWIDYLIFFHTDRDYFECHEVLEEHWKNTGMKGDCWPGLIQIAVALYHQRRGNMNGSKRMITSAIQKLEKERKTLLDLGIEVDPFFEQLEKRKREIHENSKYEPFTLPLAAAIRDICKREALKTGKEWDTKKDPDDQIIHKHRVRDRSSVIEERQKQKSQKNRIL
ncbi:DUF309 domain-containing protein [Fictibacillus nanhaiensis]|uniref:DUF309 domain-containing protein n=1 Tax=Fictibacillus nanhaiensis TaxID=742169 RepID=UPI001C95D191|nr:DUF309 domain-containing protein [Fictibacillus nanhaiensis]MBY6035637.1 DUF309 domain-containing protein [Fictibacillus nanhaiensis]